MDSMVSKRTCQQLMRACWMGTVAVGMTWTVAPAEAAADESAAQDAVSNGPLAQYVSTPDPAYGWKIRREGKLLDCDYAELILTSQSWRDTRWKHQLFVIKPSRPIADTHHALLYITGGSWRDQYDEPADGEGLPSEAQAFAALAQQLNTVVAVLLHVPHQPLFDGRYEDAIIALTFERYLETGDSSWPLLLPMVKSAVRGMDAATEYAAENWDYPVRTFTVSGASKRGWTTWLTGAVDPRATAIAPMVIDVLKMAEQMRHQRAVWGSVSEEIHDYTERGLTDELEMDRSDQLRSIVDPYNYRSVLRQPKLLMIGTNDNYWPVDALNLYWDELQEDKYILYVPNNGHGLSDMARVTGSLHALHQHAARGFRLPKLKWEYVDGQQEIMLKVAADQPARRAQVWMARSADRDFRDETWTAHAMEPNGDGSFQYNVRASSQAITALFGELVFDCNAVPYYLSTNVRVIDNSGASGANGVELDGRP